MTSKFRRTLSKEDLVQAAEDELTDLLATENLQAEMSMKINLPSSSSSQNQHQQLSYNKNRRNSDYSDEMSQMRHDYEYEYEEKESVATLVNYNDEDEESSETDFFLEGPKAPILKLEEGESVTIGNSKTTMTKSKSVRFQDPVENFSSSKNNSNNINNNNINQNDFEKKIKPKVKEVTGTMRDNINRLLDREASLDSLDDLSDQLNYSGSMFRESAEMFRRKAWWRQQRTRLLIIALAIISASFVLITILSKIL